MYKGHNGLIKRGIAMRKLYESSNLTLISIVNSTLQDEQIATLLKNIHPPAAGEITRVNAWPEIWLMNDKDYEKAKTILITFMQQEAQADHNTWDCKQCNEIIEGQFNICWNCGTSK